ncbi:MAG TPA: GrpB family protein [Candidatus Lokiarchaeia archaeon]|nr:GrpB family protein [Candidatus Lokiarchaeia archaeon]
MPLYLNRLLNIKDRIKHMGSTASKINISAKPNVDVMVGFDDLKITDTISFDQKFKKEGYKIACTDPVKIFYKNMVNINGYNAYVHILKYGGRIWRDKVAFIDFLNNNPTVAKLYSNLKEKLSQKYRRSHYTQKKTAFVYCVLLLKRLENKFYDRTEYTKLKDEILDELETMFKYFEEDTQPDDYY